MATQIGNKLVGVPLTVLAVLLTSITFQHDRQHPSHRHLPDSSSNETSTLTLQEAMDKDSLRKLIETVGRSGHTSTTLFLETYPIQLGGHVNWIAIFAPSDKAVAGDLSPILLRHMIKSGSFFGRDKFIKTFLPGFDITFGRNQQNRCLTINSQVPFTTSPFYQDLHNRVSVFHTQQIIPPLTEEDVINSNH